MMIRPRRWAYFVAATLLALGTPSLARAYIDPGTGSYMLQLLIGGAVGLLFAVKQFWRKIARPSKPDSDKPRKKE